jgi:hypothetical protein
MVMLVPLYFLIAWGVSGSIGMAALALVAILAKHVTHEVARLSVYALLYPARAQWAEPTLPLTPPVAVCALGETTNVGDRGRLALIGPKFAPEAEQQPPSQRWHEASDEIVQQVDQALRHLADFAWLGASPLVGWLGLPGETHTARGKALRQQLETAIEDLRPLGPRPKEPYPREWHAYTALRWAYVEEVPNREIMARLFISEGTFARLRRKAVRAVARNLLENVTFAALVHTS